MDKTKEVRIVLARLKKGYSKTQTLVGVRLYTGFAGAEFQDEKKPCLTNYWDAGKADLLKDYS